MPGYSRLAVGSWGELTDVGPITWALAGCLEQRERRVRHFLSRACYGAPLGAVAATGAASRCLDSWLSSVDYCRTQLAEAYASADFVLVEGRFEPHDESTGESQGGDLATLANRLDLPRVIVLDAALAADCRLPPRPDAVDAVILDGLVDREQFGRLQICVEGSWGVPVVAATERDEGLRQRVASLPRGRAVAHDLVDALVRRMSGYLQLDALDKVADRATLPQPSAPCPPVAFPATEPTIAVAYDEAFCGYFPDVLEQLEQLGARVVDFSPLSDEGLPDDADVVLLGCCKPEAFAARLAANYCMHAALRNFARRGGFIYSEGGGTAYLSRSIREADGGELPMVDLLPLTATALDEPEPFTPVEFTLGRRCPLGPRGTTLRGYRGGRYRFEPVAPWETSAADAPHDLFSAGTVVGGRMQLHFVAQPALLGSLLERRTRDDAYAVVG
jgi:cobyrinic acid a,c-diamide synthase